MRLLKKLILCVIWRFFIIIFTGKKEHKISSKSGENAKIKVGKFLSNRKSPWKHLVFKGFVGGQGGIRTHEPLARLPDFESSCQNRTWRNLTEDNGRYGNPENAVFSRLSAPVRIENAVKIRVRKFPPISPSSNGFPEKPIRIFDRTERFFAPKSRFWQCVKSTGYAELHPKSCRKMPGRSQNCRYRQEYKRKLILSDWFFADNVVYW